MRTAAKAPQKINKKMASRSSSSSSSTHLARVALAAAALALALAGSTQGAAILQSSSSSDQQQQQHQLPLHLSTAQQSLTRLSAPSPASFSSLLQSASANDQLDIWSSSSACSSSSSSDPCSIDIAASSFALSNFLLPFSNISYTTQTLISDIHSLAAQQRQSTIFDEGDVPDYGEEWHNQYHTYEEIQAYLSHLATTFPSRARLISLGQTYENRSLTALQIGHFPPQHPHEDDSLEAERSRRKKKKNKKSKEKLGVLLMANQHAREWISGATALHLIHQILAAEQEESVTASSSKKSKGRHHASSPTLLNLPLDTYEITVLPLANPDGYSYSWTGSRLWRKNRQPVTTDDDDNDNPDPTNPDCVGIDLNSNWDAGFQAWPKERACSESYPGSRPFEAYESAAIARFINDPVNKIRSVVDLHSYGQLLTYPFAFSCSPSLSLPDEEDLLELSTGAIRAMRNVHAHTFHAGRHCELTWELAGSALDWSYGWMLSSPFSERLRPREGNLVKWSFALELRDGGTYGFLLPPDQIRASGQEAGALLQYMLEFIAKREGRA
ncbi:hypothetical protein OC845_002936 [Tilletia horrida]|nr:hypothetical protein OC845_002936 [Tilletia horrida]